MVEPESLKSLEDLARENGRYPVDAYNFVREGLKYTVQKLHQANQTDQHITGRDLCLGLRDLAIKRWGLLAGLVLKHWNIQGTMDFGRIVFAMVDAGWMAKRDEDRIDDFLDIYDFRTTFNQDLTLEPESKKQ
ncbi:MAG: hypothetical protein GX629_10365 [Phycisphaerae bacterium]|jgi:uncharacterized repeat protein (TIGR04138 family)|nr:hypothetical protein [Phycisphaerae bacterium]